MASRLQDVILRGTAASRPTATTVAPGTLYYSTDTAVTERCADTGLTWETYSDGGASAAPTGASYVTLATNGTLTSERVLTAGTGITLTDAGAGSTVTIAASGGSSGLVLLEQHTASSSSSLDFTTAITSTYDAYDIWFVNIIPATTNVALRMLMSTNGGSSYDTGSNYRFNSWVVAGGTTTEFANPTTNIPVHYTTSGLSNSSTYSLNGVVRLFNPLSTATYKAVNGQTTCQINDGSMCTTWPQGWYLSTTAVNAVRFILSSGNIASGVIRMYGVAK